MIPGHAREQLQPFPGRWSRSGRSGVHDTYKGTIPQQEAFYCSRPQHTDVTFTARGCNGCEIQVMNGARHDESFWGLPERVMRNGSASFTVPRPMTRGMSVTIRAPWEGATGYTTVVAFRYAGHKTGDPVGFSDARSQHRASGCYGGTSEDSLTIPLTIRKVTVAGTTGPAAGTIAFAKATQPWLRPMEPTVKGVLGGQDWLVCTK